MLLIIYLNHFCTIHHFLVSNCYLYLFKTINEEEKQFIDHIIDNGKQIAGSLNYNTLHSLYKLI